MRRQGGNLVADGHLIVDVWQRVGGTKMTIDDKSSKFEEIKETDRKQKEVEAKEAARALEIRLEERDERLKVLHSIAPVITLIDD